MNPLIMKAYAAYDSDPRVSGPDDFDAFQDALTGLFDDLISVADEYPLFVIQTPTIDEPEPTIQPLEGWLRAWRDWSE